MRELPQRLFGWKLSVPCPRCGSDATDPCRSPTWRLVEPHQQRVALANPTGVPVHIADQSIDLLKALVLGIIAELAKDAGVELQAAVAVEVAKQQMDVQTLWVLYNDLEAIRTQRDGAKQLKKHMEEQQEKAFQRDWLHTYDAIGVDWEKTAAPAPLDWRIVSVD